jgi:GMP synthase (glutamine-hydrolysing)
MTQHQRLLIIDFGSQVTQLIARRLREQNVYCEIHPFQNVTEAFLADFAPRAVVLSGGPNSVFAPGAPSVPTAIFGLGVPILGICYGQQLMMHLLGGKVDRGQGTAEFGRAFVTPAAETLPLLDGWFGAGREQVWMSHGDHVSKIAPGFRVFGTSPNAPFAVTADPDRQFYAVQFHPEVAPRSLWLAKDGHPDCHVLRRPRHKTAPSPLRRFPAAERLRRTLSQLPGPASGQRCPINLYLTTTDQLVQNLSCV